MSVARSSTPALVALAGLAILAYATAERSLAPVRAKNYPQKMAAMRLMRRAEVAIADAKRARGITVDSHNDPDHTGVVGPQFTLITTDRGPQSAKALAAHPNFAAAVTQMMLRAGVGRGDLVAVGMTGSLPGMNLAVYSACQAIGAEPIVITSVGASTFGATDPEMTWLDMETVAIERGLWGHRSLAASLGGGGDVGRGLSPAGRQLLLRAISRNGVRPLAAPGVLDAVKERVALYDSVATKQGRPIKLYVNVGGGIVSLGGMQNGRLIPSGLTRRLAPRSYPNRGVINALGERGVPVIHLLQVERLGNEFGIIDDSGVARLPGDGPMFVQYRYNLWIVGAAAALIFFVNLFVLRLDVRHQVLGRPHPEHQETP